VRATKYIAILLFIGHYLNANEGHTSENKLLTCIEYLMWSVALKIVAETLYKNTELYL
jgi:hypothetical protein